MRVGRPVQRPREIPKAPQNFIPPILTSKTAFSAFANRRFRSSILNRGQADSYDYEDVSNNYAFRGTNVIPTPGTDARTYVYPFILPLPFIVLVRASMPIGADAAAAPQVLFRTDKKHAFGLGLALVVGQKGNFSCHQFRDEKSSESREFVTNHSFFSPSTPVPISH